METLPSKQELRKAMKARRREVPPSERAAYSAEICRRILDREDVRRAVSARGMFAVYLASPEEIDLSPLVETLWKAGCGVVVPAWRDGAYRLTGYSPDTELVSGPMGISEPASTGAGAVAVDACAVAVWIVPGLAFSRSGARLGYGGGWYDRFLSRASPSAVTIGVAYPFQIVDGIPSEPHDLPLSGVVTTVVERKQCACVSSR